MKYASFTLFILSVVVLLPSLAGCPGQSQDAVIDGIEFVWCPPGNFMMGRMPGEQDSSANEEPRHQVTFGQGFWMGKFEVTRAQWAAVMGDQPDVFSCQGCRKTENLPVIGASWDDAQAFVAALNLLRPDDTFRLPSEAEWEYACRAGATTRYYWGDDPDRSLMGQYAWYEDNSGGDEQDVGGKLPNAWGIYDMSGNVWEWVQDSGHLGYAGAPADGSAWETAPITTRTVRGGSYYNATGCRSAYRGFVEPNNHFTDYGFRIVKTANAGAR